MKCVVMGYHNIGCVGIEALLDNGFEIAAVFTHKDNPKENIWFNSVAELASAKGIPVYAPEDVNHPVWLERIRAMQPEIIFSFYYRNMLKSELLDIPPKGCINLHGSLLPKYRGRVPINWALVNGETETGVTMHYMTLKPDAGNIIAQEKIAIEDCDTAKTLHLKAAKASAELLAKTLPDIKSGSAPSIPQSEADATYFGGRGPADGEIDWKKSATVVRNLVRAVTLPYPGAFSFMGDRKCIFWKVSVVENNAGAAPGTVISSSPLLIACEDGAVKVESAQLENGVLTTGEQFAQDARIVKNTVFGCNPRVAREAARKKSVLILGVNG
ncbi:MAG: formyltransferase, partial [Victivallales bacterium]